MRAIGQSITAIAKLAPNAKIGEGLSVHYSGGSSLSKDVAKWLEKNGVKTKQCIFPDMPISAKIRMPLDIAMTVATLVLMGDNYFFESTAVHEILGVVLLVLWAVAKFSLRRRVAATIRNGASRRWN